MHIIRVVIALLIIISACATAEARHRFFKVHDTSSTDLFCVHNRIYGLTVSFQVDRPTDVKMSGFVNLKHRGNVTGFYGAVGWSLWIQHRYAPTYAGLNAVAFTRVKGSKPSGNISAYDEHYKDASLDGYEHLEDIGVHEYTVWGSSASDGRPGQDGLIEVNDETATTWPSNQWIFDVYDEP